jgi:hypothetical protein
MQEVCDLSLIHLAKGILCSSFLMTASSYTLPSATPLQTVRWTALVVMLLGLYYASWGIWRACRRRRHPRGVELSNLNPNPLSEPAYANIEASQTPDPPHLTTTSVYVYVYGWGVLLFVSLYCMAGLHEASSCWWAAGMLMLSFDELVAREAPRMWVVLISTLLWLSIAFLWWASSGSVATEENLGTIVIGTAVPVLTPFIFFSLRSIRIVSRDVMALCEVALPFMILIAFGVLASSDWNQLLPPDPNPISTTPQTRRANLTYIETPSFFNPNWTDLPVTSLPAAYVRLNKYLILLGVPFLACASLVNLATCVLQGFVTEFISAFLLVLTVKFIVIHNDSSWSGELALAAAAMCFVVLILLRRTL